MLKIVKEKEPFEDIHYELTFLLKEDPSGGLFFPCDKDGNIEQLNPAAQENYEYALANPDKYLKPQVKKIIYRGTNPAEGICNCGERLLVENQYMGAFECPSCGQWYNLFGQELLPPDEWNDLDDY